MQYFRSSKIDLADLSNIIKIVLHCWISISRIPRIPTINYNVQDVQCQDVFIITFTKLLKKTESPGVCNNDSRSRSECPSLGSNTHKLLINGGQFLNKFT